MLDGSFHGELIVKLLDDGRRVQLMENFSYTDPQDLPWRVPKGATVDGASIPRPLWTLLGGPFEGKYRNASVIHDWYCDRRSRPWQAVHRVFYDAMITSGVPEQQAKVLYAGVRWGGPRWSETVELNVRLDQPRDDHAKMALAVDRLAGVEAVDMVGDRGEGYIPQPYRLPLGEASFEKLAAELGGRDLSLSEIEQLVDGRTSGLTPVEGVEGVG